MSTATSAEHFNATDYLVGRHVRAGAGARTAVVSPHRTLTYEQLWAEVRRLAAGLRELGVRPEERVLMCMADDIELFTSILATMHLGAVAVPSSTMLTAPELHKLVVDSRARVVLGSCEYGGTVCSALENAPDVRQLVLTGADYDMSPYGVPAHSWQQVSESGADHEQGGALYSTWPDSPALWLYTSGTTGAPKAAMHRHADIKVVSENYGQQVLGVVPGDRCLSVAKLFFAYGIGNSMFFPLAAGATALLEPGRPAPETLADRARKHRATVLFGTPSFWGPLLASSVPDDAFSSVRQGVSAGEALPPRMYQGMLDRFGVEVLDGIGSTELLHIFISNRAGRVHPGSSGYPVPGYDVEIRDEQGGVIHDAGKPGELYVRGDSAATGYWCRAGTSREVFLGDWMRTGDTYVRNTDGTYSCLGRRNDMLKAGGIWVTPGEVEDRLLDHPEVAEAVVVGVPDSDDLDKPVACVVPVEGRHVDGEVLIQWCRDGLASFKRPRAVLELTELPKTPTGKIRRNVLRDKATAELGCAPGVQAEDPVENS
jgi:benzoate-CoA ligase